jgi:hypothetical protein
MAHVFAKKTCRALRVQQQTEPRKQIPAYRALRTDPRERSRANGAARVSKRICKFQSPPEPLRSPRECPRYVSSQMGSCVSRLLYLFPPLNHFSRFCRTKTWGPLVAQPHIRSHFQRPLPTKDISCFRDVPSVWFHVVPIQPDSACGWRRISRCSARIQDLPALLPRSDCALCAHVPPRESNPGMRRLPESLRVQAVGAKRRVHRADSASRFQVSFPGMAARAETAFRTGSGVGQSSLRHCRAFVCRRL